MYIDGVMYYTASEFLGASVILGFLIAFAILGVIYVIGKILKGD